MTSYSPEQIRTKAKNGLNISKYGYTVVHASKMCLGLGQNLYSPEAPRQGGQVRGEAARQVLRQREGEHLHPPRGVRRPGAQSRMVQGLQGPLHGGGQVQGVDRWRHEHGHLGGGGAQAGGRGALQVRRQQWRKGGRARVQPLRHRYDI